MLILAAAKPESLRSVTSLSSMNRFYDSRKAVPALMGRHGGQHIEIVPGDEQNRCGASARKRPKTSYLALTCPPARPSSSSAVKTSWLWLAGFTSSKTRAIFPCGSMINVWRAATFITRKLLSEP
jgi:hypothetical protein